MHKAFLPGAGLGTRLQPITHRLPKPLVPLYHQPLAVHALDACRRGGFVKFAINTHHLPEQWPLAFPPADPCPWRGENGIDAWQARHAACPVTFFHEPVLLNTGGGVRNLVEWLGRSPFLVHNTDIFSTLPLQRLLDAHLASGLPVTLALRSHGHALHVAVDPSATRVTDIRRLLDRAEGTHLFTGIWCAGPELLEKLPPRQPVSVIPAFLELAAAGLLGCVVIDEGAWLDLGDPATLLAAHLDPPVDPGVPRLHAQAEIDDRAMVDDRSWVGPRAQVAAGARLEECWLMPGARVGPGLYQHCIVLDDGTVLKV